MYKLVAIGGKLRGNEYILEDGSNSIGRGSDNDLYLNVEGISKKHANITVTKDGLYLEDLGSSNGTFVNGELVKTKNIVNGDKIALPNVIFQVVLVLEKKIIIKKKIQSEKDDAYSSNEVVPKDLVGKIKYIFRTKVMPIFYGFNEQYEWRVLFGILLFIFIVVNIFLTIAPVLLDSKKFLLTEIAKRGVQYADEVARLNAAALNRRDLDRINTGFLDHADGVQTYELFDMEGRIVRPQSKLNQYINDPFSVDAAKVFKTNESLQKPYVKVLSDGKIGIGKAIKAFDNKTGRSEVVGIIAIHFLPNTLTASAANNSKAYLEALSTSALVAILFFGIIYYLTTKHIGDLKNQIELVLRGKEKELSSTMLMEEINPLRNSINAILQRIRELQQEEGGDFVDIEEDTTYVQSLYEFMQGSGVATLVLNSEKNIQYLNSECEDLIGMRETSSVDTSLLDSMRDQGLAATVIDLCDQSANNEGTYQFDEYEIGGILFKVNIVSLMGKDNFAKGYYITFTASE